MNIEEDESFICVEIKVTDDMKKQAEIEENYIKSFTIDMIKILRNSINIGK